MVMAVPSSVILFVSFICSLWHLFQTEFCYGILKLRSSVHVVHYVVVSSTVCS